MDVTDTSALVTGAASGLGAATAAMLAGRGVRVFGVDLPAALENAPDAPGVTRVPADVTDREQVREAVAAAAGSGPLRTVVNCAGIGPSARVLGRQGVHDLDLFETVLRVNLLGTFTVLALAAERIAATDPVDDDGQRGLVVNTASVAAFEGQVGQAAYAASKGGVHSLGITAARDLASAGIRVNTIAPGVIETPMLAAVGDEFRAALAAGVPFPRRLGRPREFAQLVAAFLDNDYLNGTTVRMDGALRMAPR
ncbi:SDR family NAD(P)-dependent oxidoreductase [Kocuria sp. CPCC 205263]|uniref:SDR family NAD(P)-dependent oxidoreductase n=1 Tax=Kocuria sp. CPCC 205263 TaxID=3073555 RepID=UPI0034D654CF